MSVFEDYKDLVHKHPPNLISIESEGDRLFAPPALVLMDSWIIGGRVCHDGRLSQIDVLMPLEEFRESHIVVGTLVAYHGIAYSVVGFDEHPDGRSVFVSAGMCT